MLDLNNTPDSTPCMSTNYIQKFQTVFKDRASDTALISQENGNSLTYSQLHKTAQSISNRFNSLGLDAGSEIVFICENSLDLVLAIFGAWQAGLVVTPINPDLPMEQARQILADVAPAMIVLSPKQLGQSAFQDFNVCGLHHHKDETDRPSVMDHVTKTDATSPLFSKLDPDNVFLRVFTSGSTSAPKGVEVSFNGLVGNERLFCKTMGISHENRFYNFFPMSYLAGLHNTLLLPLCVGGSVLIGSPLGGANLYGLWEDVQDHHVNTLWFTGAMLSMILKLRPDDDEAWIGEQIRLGIVGMAPLDLSVKAQFESRFGFELFENYGLSETTFLSTHIPGQYSNLNSKGYILEGVKITVVDENKSPLGSSGRGDKNQVGELLIKTPYLMLGYSGPSSKDHENLTTEGFYTGDLGYIEDDQLYVVGRKKDLIIRGGLNIAPAIVEKVLMEVAPIREVAVVGVKDDVYGEEVGAVLVLREGVKPFDEDELIHLIGDKLAQFQLPKHLKFVDLLPRGLTGKIDKLAAAKIFDK